MCFYTPDYCLKPALIFTFECIPLFGTFKKFNACDVSAMINAITAASELKLLSKSHMKFGHPQFNFEAFSNSGLKPPTDPAPL